MLESELTNRIYKNEFQRSQIKLAFLPHCLRDLSRECKAAVNEIDYVCGRCSKKCYLRDATEILKAHGVDAYIWMTADLKKIFQRLRNAGQRPGVLRIACIPELVWGMRMCTKQGIPVIGLPLNANSCARWMGKFYDNSLNLNELQKLLC